LTIQPDFFASGTFFSRIFHASPVAMSITLPGKKQYIDVNDAYAALVGSSRESLIGQDNTNLVYQDGSELAGDESLSEESLCLRTADGQFRDVIASTQLQEWDSQTFVITLVHDLSAYNRTQAALRTSEARFRLFFESIPLPIFVFDFETWRILEVNNATLKLYGYSREELMEMTMLDIRPPETIEHYVTTIRGLPAATRYVGVWQHRKKNGDLIDVELTSYAFELDGCAARLHVLRDVTERLALQQALRHSEELLRVIATVTTDVIWDIDLASRTMETAGLFELFGYNSVTTRPWQWWFDHIHPDDRPAIEAGIQAALDSGKTAWSGHYRFLHADGRYMNVHDRAQIMRDGNGAPRRMIGATIDVTRQIEVQEATTLAKLEERRRLARDLHDAVTQSLYSLSLMAEVARRHATAGDEAAANEYINRLGTLALQSLKEMRLLVYELRPSALEHEGLLGALQSRLDAVERRSGIQAQLVEDIQQPLPSDVQVQLFLIAEEALNNALKHASAVNVRLRIATNSESTILEVSDDGKGFDPTPTQPPSGLGLVSMRERAESLGGRFELETADGHGTTIRVTLRNVEGDNEQTNSHPDL
jgi:PAS domain S-box-containing protein